MSLYKLTPVVNTVNFGLKELQKVLLNMKKYKCEDYSMFRLMI